MKTMQRYYASFKIFAATFLVTKVLSTFGLAFLVLACFGVVGELFVPSGKDNFWSGFMEGFAPMSCVFVAVIGVMLLNVIFTYNYPINTGYKYFHSLASGGKRFKEAIVFANVLGVIIILVCSVLYYALFMLADTGFLPLLFPGFGLACLGIADLTGFVKNQWVRFFYIMPMCLVAGFISGFSVSADEDDELPGIITSPLTGAIFLAVGIVVFIVGFVFIHYRAEKKWGMMDASAKSGAFMGKGGSI